MTSIMSSPGGSAVYSSQLSQLLAANQSADNDDTSGAANSVPASQTVPSLASVLSTDDTTGVGAQATSTINSLMMQIQALKAGTASTASSTTDSTSTTDGTQPLDQQQSGAVHGHHRHHGGGGAQEAAKAFSKIDTDKSGSVSLAEFVAGRPKDMSEEDATKIFKSIDTAGTGSITEDQFAANLKAGHEKAGAAHHAKGADGVDSQPDMKALAQDLVTQLKVVIQTFNNGYVDGGESNAPADTTAIG
ncbi:Ca2+-binding EF-hand superfamily protein [Rhizobium aquaticum]|uniref:Ca2+-binding EF-hand superfamily protein n=1 Tax=Rhizobium aquaticum TaxID=1549636 RepID=A0ABV2IUH5_9HYPH